MSEMTTGLVERIEAASWPDIKLDGDIAEALSLVPPFVSKRDSAEWSSWRGGRDTWTAPRFTGSIDAAMTLVPEGWHWSMDNFDGACGHPAAWIHKPNSDDEIVSVTGKTPALALCAAALRARAPLPAPPAKDTI